MNEELTPASNRLPLSPALLGDLREIISRGQAQATAAVNNALALMNLQKDNIMVAEYWTELPPKEVLEKKLQTALIEIQTRLAERKLIEEP